MVRACLRPAMISVVVSGCPAIMVPMICCSSTHPVNETASTRIIHFVVNFFIKSYLVNNFLIVISGFPAKEPG